MALPSWLRPIAALNSVRPMSTTPVATWPGRNRLRTPAASRTICIGSAYWRRNACQRGSLGGSANLFGPYLARRASTSAAAQAGVDRDPLAFERVVGRQGVPGDGRLGVAVAATVGHRELLPLSIGRTVTGQVSRMRTATVRTAIVSTASRISTGHTNLSHVP